MPAIPSEQLTTAIIDAINTSGFSAQIISPARTQPRKFLITGSGSPTFLTVYAWTLTFGGRPSLANEYRIQMTVDPPLQVAPDGPTVLIGYEQSLNLFAGFDLARHKDFTSSSPSVQIDIGALRQSEATGLSFHKKGNGEIAVGIRGDMFMAYAMNASVLHRYGNDSNVVNLLNQAVTSSVPPPQIQSLAAERKRVVTEISRLSRDAAFRRRVLFAYGNRCAISRVQLRLVDAAHILPVGADGSTDFVQNGLALSPTYHRAFDAGLIYLNEKFEMKINPRQLQILHGLNLVGGVELFKQSLGSIFLPPDLNQRPSLEFIKRANDFRHIGG